MFAILIHTRGNQHGDWPWGIHTESQSKAHQHAGLQMGKHNLDTRRFIWTHSHNIEIACNDQFGIGLVQEWSRKRVVICSSKALDDHDGGSSIIAWPFQLVHSQGRWNKNIVELFNVTISSSATRPDGSLGENSIRASCSRVSATSSYDPWTIDLSNKQVLAATKVDVAWGSIDG